VGIARCASWEAEKVAGAGRKEREREWGWGRSDSQGLRHHGYSPRQTTVVAHVVVRVRVVLVHRISKGLARGEHVGFRDRIVLRAALSEPIAAQERARGPLEQKPNATAG